MNYKKKVAQGLRTMKKEPDAFLFINIEQAWDESAILGFPVFHSAFIANPMTDDDVPFIPLWQDESDYTLERKRFNDGYVL